MFMALKKTFLNIIELLYPDVCPVCNQIVVQEGGWCHECRPKILMYEVNLNKHHYNLKSCVTLFAYEESLRFLLKKIKFYKNKKAIFKIHYLLNLLNENEIKNILKEYDCVIPVPLSRQRLKERGFNQTNLIFEKWLKEKGCMWLEALERTKETKAQWTLKAFERAINVKNAFSVQEERKNSLKNKKILLVDDIFTTGFTMASCAESLKNADVKEVGGLVLASGALLFKDF